MLPVLAIKVSGLIQAKGQSITKTRQQFLASAAGIFASYTTPAFFMSMLRISEEEPGWGIQYQSSGFLIAIAAIAFLFTASLFDLLQIRLPSSLSTKMATCGGNGLGGHFAQGAFATLLATPCTAPFLGAAIAWALAAPLTELWLLFLFMGTGMSLPWLLIALFPGLTYFLPKPGPWMRKLRTVLGIMMFTSCMWLLSLLVSHLGLSVVVMIVAVLFVLLAIWLTIKDNLSRAFFVLLLPLLATTYHYTTREAFNDDALPWRPLSEKAIAEAIKNSNRIFINVTADWCVTCLVNQRRVLHDEEVRRSLLEPDMVLFKGDWSQADPEISAFLKKRSSVAVPFNQFCGPGLPDGLIFEPLLSKRTVLNALHQARHSSPVMNNTR